MNKETEMYLIKRIEELSAKYTVAEKEKEILKNANRLISNTEYVCEYRGYPVENMFKKANAFDVLSKFMTIANDKLVFIVPEIELNRDMKKAFEELLYGE